RYLQKVKPERNIFRAHPWHGISAGDEAPAVVTCYIEIVPTDTVKYELDKVSGHLTIDRPQHFSSMCPTLYGLVPRTFCGERVAARCRARTGQNVARADGDPLDICVLTEKQILHGDILLDASPIGGLRMIDNGEADDKIIAVLRDDLVYGRMRDLADCHKAIVDRLVHYFLSYKRSPASESPPASIAEIYDREEAHQTVRLACADYDERFA
ncbi:MAG TPA: inorganic pyrophosphatase, partial [Bryobacteraceae bacterium]|nr:inorganic pyrophosphatase [Bryobacteraceae bacterium]